MQRFSILSFLILTMIVSNNGYVEARPYKDGDGMEQSKDKRESYHWFCVLCAFATRHAIFISIPGSKRFIVEQ